MAFMRSALPLLQQQLQRAGGFAGGVGGRCTLQSRTHTRKQMHPWLMPGREGCLCERTCMRACVRTWSKRTRPPSLPARTHSWLQVLLVPCHAQRTTISMAMHPSVPPDPCSGRRCPSAHTHAGVEAAVAPAAAGRAFSTLGDFSFSRCARRRCRGVPIPSAPGWSSSSCVRVHMHWGS